MLAGVCSSFLAMFIVGLLNASLYTFLYRKFPREVLASHETMQLLVSCATRIEHMQVVCRTCTCVCV